MDARNITWTIFIVAIVCVTSTSQVQHQEMDILKLVRQSKTPADKTKTWIIYQHPSKDPTRNRTSPYIFDTQTNSASWWQQFKAFSRRSSLLDLSHVPMVKSMPSSIEHLNPPAVSERIISADVGAPSYPYFIQDIERFILRDSIIDDTHLSSSKNYPSDISQLKSIPDDTGGTQPVFIPKASNTKSYVQYVTPGVEYSMSEVKYVTPEVEYVTEMIEVLEEVPKLKNSSSSSSKVDYVQPSIEYLNKEDLNSTLKMNVIDKLALSKATVGGKGKQATKSTIFFTSMAPTRDPKQISNSKGRKNGSSGTRMETPRRMVYGKRKNPKKSAGKRSSAAKLVSSDSVSKGRMSRRIDSNSLSDSIDASIPGIPEEDYPTLKSIPITDFDCAAEDKFGYFADVDTKCQAFHICHANGMDTFLCPVGTMFNQQYLVCDWWYNVDCEESEKYYKFQDAFNKLDSANPEIVSSLNSAGSISAKKAIDHTHLNEFEFDDENLEEYLELHDKLNADENIDLAKTARHVEDIILPNNDTLQETLKTSYFGGSKPFYHFAGQNDVKKHLAVATSQDKSPLNSYLTVSSPYLLPIGNSKPFDKFTADTDLFADAHKHFGNRQTEWPRNKEVFLRKTSKTGWWGQMFQFPPSRSSKNHKTTLKKTVKAVLDEPIQNVKRYIIIRPHHQTQLKNDSILSNHPLSEINKSGSFMQESVLEPLRKEVVEKFDNTSPNSWKVMKKRPSEHQVTTLSPTTRKPLLEAKYDDPFIIYLSNTNKKSPVDARQANKAEIINSSLFSKKSRKNPYRRPKFGDRLNRNDKRYFEDSKIHVVNYSPYREEESVAKNIYSKMQNMRMKPTVNNTHYSTDVKVANPKDTVPDSLVDIKPVISKLQTELSRIPNSRVMKFGNTGNKVVVRLGDTVTISEAKVTKAPKNFSISSHRKMVMSDEQESNATTERPTHELPPPPQNLSNYTQSVRVESKLLQPSVTSYVVRNFSTPGHANITSAFNRPVVKKFQHDAVGANKPKILYYDELNKLKDRNNLLRSNVSNSQVFLKVTNRDGGFRLFKNEKAINNTLPRLEIINNHVLKTTNNSSTKFKMNLPKVYAFFPNDLVTKNVTNDILSKQSEKT